VSYACIGERILNNMIGNKTVYMNIKTLNTKRLFGRVLRCWTTI